MLIDTHCHLSKDDYENVLEVIENNRRAGIGRMIISGCTRKSIEETFEIVSGHDDLYATIGFHPSEASIVSDDDIKYLIDCLHNLKVVGIGEIGLDYHYGKDDIIKQKDLFRKQLDIAKELDLPVVIHSRDATEDTINILKEYPGLRGDIHCFSGSLETAKIYISMGYYLGVGGVVTFKNSKLIDVIDKIGLDHVVLETDSPYLTPEPDRGKKNSSKYIINIAKYIADKMNISIELVSDITSSNAFHLFDLK